MKEDDYSDFYGKLVRIATMVDINSKGQRYYFDVEQTNDSFLMLFNGIDPEELKLKAMDRIHPLQKILLKKEHIVRIEVLDSVSYHNFFPDAIKKHKEKDQ